MSSVVKSFIHPQTQEVIVVHENPAQNVDVVEAEVTKKEKVSKKSTPKDVKSEKA